MIYILHGVTIGDSMLKPKLTTVVKPEDYGKPINYSVTVKNSSNQDVTLTNWRVFYNDGNNVYIILDNYLNNKLIDTTKTKTTISGTYAVFWKEGSVTDHKEVEASLTNTDNWSKFAAGNGAQSATGGPTKEMFVASWNENPNTNSNQLTVGNSKFNLTDSTGLYILPEIENIYSYWLASRYTGGGIATEYWMWLIMGGSSGSIINSAPYIGTNNGVRPVVCLQSSVTGTVGESLVTME